MLKYHSLRDKVFSLKNLYAAFHHVKKNKGKAGLEKVSIKQFERDLENNIQNIHKELKTEIYQPSPVLRVYIPKGKHDKRPLGIPIVKDRVVRQAFRQIIEPIFEKEFSDNSFGFRPERCCHDAIKYADDFVVMTKTQEELPAALKYVKEIIEGKLGMKLSEDKTKLTNFKRCFKFSRKWKTDNKRFPVRRFSKMGLLSFERVYCNACAKA